MSVPKESFGFDDNKNIKLVIYDFDQTISSLHLYHELEGGQEDALSKMSDDKLLKVFGGKERVSRLNTHFDRISTAAEIAILSFGYVGVIRTALKRMNLNEYFENKVIIGKDSDELKNAGSKAKCISKLKKKRNLKSDQVIFVDDDNQNIQKAMSYCFTKLIKPRCGMTYEHMKEIEERVGINNYKEPLNLELTTPKTVKSEISKHYPSSQEMNDKLDNKKKNDLAKFKPNVPDWFDSLTNPKNETPVIQIGGDQTPGSDSADFELNVPILNEKLNDLANDNDDDDKTKKNGFSFGLTLNTTSDNEENEDNDKNNDK